MVFYATYPTGPGPGAGVTSLNGLTGALTLLAGSGITITPSGSTLTIAATGGGGGSGTVTSVALADSTGLFNITGSPVTTAGTLTLASFQSQAANTFFAAPNGSAGSPTFRLIVPADVPTLNQNTTGTASNITATSNSTLTTLSVLSLPGAQVTGNIAGNAANITATSNSTLTTLTALSLPGAQVTGNIAGNAANITATSNSTLTTLTALSLPGAQVTGNISGNAGNITATSNSTLTTLTALSLPFSQVTGTVPTTQGGTGLTSYTTGDTLYASATNTLTQLPIGTTGQILTVAGGVPVWAANVAFTPVNMSAYLNTDITPYTIGSVIIFDTVQFDTASGYSTVTGLYTFPATGVYQVGSYILTRTSTANASDNVAIRMAIRKNGTSVYFPDSQNFDMKSTSGNYLVTLGGATLVSVTAGDTMSVVQDQSNGTNIANHDISGASGNPPSTYFQITRVA